MSLTRRARAEYAAGSLGTGIFSTVPAVLLLYFCTETLRIDAAAATAIVLLPKLWAVLWDPLVGRWSDVSRNRFGRRRPFLLAGAAGVALSFWALFAPPELPRPWLAAWAGAAYFLLTMFYSTFAVPYLAVPAEIEAAEPARAALVGWRMTAAMAGVLVGGAAGPLVVGAGGGGREGYALMGLVLGALCLAAMLLPLRMLPAEYGRSTAQSGRPAVRARFRAPPRAFLFLAGGYVTLLAACGMLSAALPYVVTGRFRQGEAAVGLALGVMLLTTVLLMPAWAWAARCCGPLSALRAAVGGLALVAVALASAVSPSGSWTMLLLVMILFGAAFAGMQLLPYLLVTQLTHAEARDDACHATWMGFWAASEKVGLALGPAAFGVLLAATGSTGSDEAAALFFAAGVPVLALLAAALLSLRGRDGG